MSHSMRISTQTRASNTPRMWTDSGKTWLTVSEVPLNILRPSLAARNKALSNFRDDSFCSFKVMLDPVYMEWGTPV